MIKSDTQEIQETCRSLRNGLYTHLHIWHTYDDMVRDDLQSQFVSAINQLEETVLRLAEDRAGVRDENDLLKIRDLQQANVIHEQGRVIDSLQTVVATVAHLCRSDLQHSAWERVALMRTAVGVTE